MSTTSGLRGFIDKVETGEDFVVVSGWAATEENRSLGSELILRINGISDFPIPKLTYRIDLEAAGIAGGIAAFIKTVRYAGSIEENPQIFALTKHANEIPLSGPGTLYTTFTSAAAIDNVDERGVSGWLFNPAEGLRGRRAPVLSVNRRVPVKIIERFSRPDLPYDADTDQMFGFFIPRDKLNEALEGNPPISESGAHLLELISGGVSVASFSFMPPSDAARRPSAPFVLSALSESPIIHVERVYRGERLIAVFGWMAQADKSGIDAPVTVSLPSEARAVIPELDFRGDLARNGIASGRAAFGVVLPWESEGLPPSLSVEIGGAKTARRTINLPEKRIHGGSVVANLVFDGRRLKGTHIDLDQGEPAHLLIDGLYRLTLNTSALSEGARCWGESGQLASGFTLGVRQLLGHVRALDPTFALSAHQSTVVELLAGTAAAASLRVQLTQIGKGRFEKLSSSQGSGWLVLPAGQGAAEYDVYVNEVRYKTAFADRPRRDLVEKGLAKSGGGFQFEVHNPDTVAQPLAIEVRQAFTNVSLSGDIKPVDTTNVARANLTQLYAVLESAHRRRVTIIVPIYNAADDLPLCIESLVSHTSAEAQLLLIDDCSPDPRIREVLASAAGLKNVQVLHNEVNLGFTKTVNKGIRLAGEDDVIFLNSDTIVSPRWLQGLRIAAYSGARVATATALSNNSGVFSVPEINIDNALPQSFEIEDFGRLVGRAAAATYPRVPTGNGFCMFVRRDALERLGPLDEESFPVGYGEENDFCMRALRDGFENVCDDQTFVFHKRSASFGPGKSIHLDRGRLKMRERYPEYTRITGIFETGHEMLDVRWRVRRALVAAKGTAPRPRVAFVISTTTGGTPQTNLDLMSALSDRYEPWVLRCDSQQIELQAFDGVKTVQVTSIRLRNRINPTLHRSLEYNEEMINLLVLYNIELVHIRHLGWHGLDLPKICAELAIPVVFSFHDFYSVCPTIKLLDENRTYCAGHCTSSGGDCSVELWEQSSFPLLKNGFVHRWREMFSEAFRYCDAFVTTSEYAQTIYSDVFSGKLTDRFHIIPHGRSFAAFEQLASPVQPGGPLRVLVPGNISPAKGAELIVEVLALDVEETLEFHILGDAGRMSPRRGLVLHGRYKRDDFASRVRDINPHIGAVLSIWPETYCHTLTEMWSIGIPVVGIDIGAVGERIGRHGGGWRFPPGLQATEILHELRRVRDNAEDVVRKVEEVVAWQVGFGSSYDTNYMGVKYDRLYRETMTKRRVFAPTSTAIREIAVVCGSRGAEDRSSIMALTSNESSTPTIFWHVGENWATALEEEAIEVDAMLVVLDTLVDAEEALIATIARRRNTPVFLLVGSAASEKANDSPILGTNRKCHALVSAASEIFTIGQAAQDLVCDDSMTICPLSSIDARKFGRLIASKFELLQQGKPPKVLPS